MRKFFTPALEGHALDLAQGNLSLEEEQVMLDEAAADQAEATQDLAEAERIIEVSDALEDLAVVADGIEEATPAEAALVEIAGDMAVAGTDVAPDEVVPAMEGFVGRKIATEGIRETAKAIWKSIMDFLKKIWEKVEGFFYKIFGTIPSLRRRLKALEKRIDDASGKSLGETKKIKVSVGLSALTVNDKVVKSGSEVKAAVKDLADVASWVFSEEMDDIAKLGEDIADAVGDFDPADPAKAPTAILNLFSRGMKNNSNMPGGTAYNGPRWADFKVEISKPLLGNVSLIVKAPNLKPNYTPLAALDVVRRVGGELVPTKEKSSGSAPSDVEMNALTPSEMQDLIDGFDTLLNKMETYQRGKGANAVKRAKEKLESASKKASDSYEKMRGGEDAGEKAALPYYKSILNFNVAYARWVQSPAMPMISRTITSMKAVMNLCDKSLALYTK